MLTYFSIPLLIPWIPEVFFSRATRSFVDRRLTRVRKAEHTHGEAARKNLRCLGYQKRGSLFLRLWFLLSGFSRLCGQNSQKRNDGYQHSYCSRCRFLDWKCFSSSFLFFFCFKFYGVTLFCPNITITISSAVSLPWQNTIHTKIKTIISRPVEFYLFQLISIF